jgi:prepilin-type N-terminal cleavage/methylation domain-containing protein
MRDFQLPRPLRPPLQGGFTLVEMLVATVVLVLLVVMVAQLTSSTASTTNNSQKHMNADSQARMIFDRMANDFARMVNRKDVDYVFCKSVIPGATGSNDAMFFYSEVPAFYDNVTNSKNTVALVGYRINSNLQLERLGKGLTWDGATVNSANPPVPGGVVFLAFGSNATPLFSTTIAGDGTTTNPGNWTTIGSMAGGNLANGSGSAYSAYSDGTDPDYHVLSDEAYRMDIAFQLSDGTISTFPVLSIMPSNWPTGTLFYKSSPSDPVSTNDSSQSYAIGSRWYNTSTGQGYICTNATTGAAVWNRIGIQDISAVIVTIAILDTTSRNIAASTNSMVNALRNPTSADFSSNPPVLMEQTWLNAVNSPTFATSSKIPRAAASQVRAYQRYFYINSATE